MTKHCECETCASIMNKYGPVIIGLAGGKGSGKTTLAKHIITTDFLYKSWKILSFAQPIKDALSSMLRIGIHYFTNEQLKEKSLKDKTGIDITPRQLMQLFGTEFGRHLVHKDIWIKLMESEIRKYYNKGVSIIIDDIRFQNEVDLIKNIKFSNKTGGTVFLIDADRDVRDNHASEQVDLKDVIKLKNEFDGIDKFVTESSKEIENVLYG